MKLEGPPIHKLDTIDKVVNKDLLALDHLPVSIAQTHYLPSVGLTGFVLSGYVGEYK